MTNAEFEHVSSRFETLAHSILRQKSEEYATPEDRLVQFFQVADLKGCSPLEALIGMAVKHFSSLSSLASSRNHRTALWTEKLVDLHNYCVLAYALVHDPRVAFSNDEELPNANS